MKDKFYGAGLLEQLLLDPFKYRGRGRPRKIDYSTLKEIQEKMYNLRARFIENNNG